MAAAHDGTGERGLETCAGGACSDSEAVVELIPTLGALSSPRRAAHEGTGERGFETCAGGACSEECKMKGGKGGGYFRCDRGQSKVNSTAGCSDSEQLPLVDGDLQGS